MVEVLGSPAVQGSPAFRGADFAGQSLVLGQGSTALRGAQSGVGRQSRVAGHGSTALRGLYFRQSPQFLARETRKRTRRTRRTKTWTRWT